MTRAAMQGRQAVKETTTDPTPIPIDPRERAIVYGRRFGKQLRNGMSRRRVSVAELAQAMPSQTGTIVRWRAGRLPLHEMAVRAAEALDWQVLIDLSLEARTKVCACGRTFVDKSPGLIAVHCGRQCAWSHHNGLAKVARASSTRTRLKRAGFLERDYDALLQRIADHCWECEPDGVCHNAAAPSPGVDCRFRDYSPLVGNHREDARHQAREAQRDTVSAADLARIKSARRKKYHREWMREDRAVEEVPA